MISIPSVGWGNYECRQQYLTYHQSGSNWAIGILLVAKQRGYVVAIKPLLHNLMTVAGFWIDQELYKRVLENAQEL